MLFIVMGVVSCRVSVSLGYSGRAKCLYSHSTWQKSNQFHICWRVLTLRHSQTPNGECCQEEFCSTWWLKGLLTPFIWHQSAHTFVALDLLKQQFYLHELRQRSTSVCPCAPRLCSVSSFSCFSMLLLISLLLTGTASISHYSMVTSWTV